MKMPSVGFISSFPVPEISIAAFAASGSNLPAAMRP